MQPHKSILTRTPEPQAYQNLLNEASNLIEEIVNCGTHLFVSIIQKKENASDDSSLTISALFRHCLDSVDAISILVRQGAFDSSEPILRSLLETFLGLEYVLEKDTFRRALSYQVCYAHARIKMHEQLDSQSEVGIKFRELFKKDTSIDDITIPDFNVSTTISKLKNALLRPEIEEVEAEYQRLKGNGKRFSWFTLFDGPKNVKELADRLQRPAMYELLYRQWSNGVHASDAIENFRKNSLGQSIVYGLRRPENIQSYFSLGTSLILEVYRKVNLHYFESDQGLRNWYLSVRHNLNQISERIKDLKFE